MDHASPLTRSAVSKAVASIPHAYCYSQHVHDLGTSSKRDSPALFLSPSVNMHCVLRDEPTIFSPFAFATFRICSFQLECMAMPANTTKFRMAERQVKGGNLSGEDAAVQHGCRAKTACYSCCRANAHVCVFHKDVCNIHCAVSSISPC